MPNRTGLVSACGWNFTKLSIKKSVSWGWFWNMIPFHIFSLWYIGSFQLVPLSNLILSSLIWRTKLNLLSKKRQLEEINILRNACNTLFKQLMLLHRGIEGWNLAKDRILWKSIVIQQKDVPFRKCSEDSAKRPTEIYSFLGACNTNLSCGTTLPAYV